MALDRAFSHVLSPAQVAHARERVARRAAALSNIYLPRITSVARHTAGSHSDLTRVALELEDTHRALAAALAGPRTRDQGRTKDQAPRTKD
jgi:hypothetical protein